MHINYKKKLTDTKTLQLLKYNCINRIFDLYFFDQLVLSLTVPKIFTVQLQSPPIIFKPHAQTTSAVYRNSLVHLISTNLKLDIDMYVKLFSFKNSQAVWTLLSRIYAQLHFSNSIKTLRSKCFRCIYIGMRESIEARLFVKDCVLQCFFMQRHSPVVAPNPPKVERAMGKFNFSKQSISNAETVNVKSCHPG